MSSQPVSIQCPNCGGSIYFDPKQLLLGINFACGKCQSQIGLASEDRPLVSETLEKFQQLKGQPDKNKNA